MAILLDQFGREMKPVKRPDMATLAAAPILDSWRDYVSAGLTPQILTTLLKEADGGNVRRQAELFEQMEEKDAHLLGEIEKRRNAVLDIDFAITPASEDSRDIKVAEFVKMFLDNFTDFDETIVSLQDAVGKGFSALEINWDISAGQAMPNGFDFIEQKRFSFRDAAGHLRKYPTLFTDTSPMGEEIPAFKLLFHRYGGKSGHAVKSGIYRVCAWMYLFKNYALKDWVSLLEVFGIPLRLGKYDGGASQADKDALIDAIQSLGSDAAGIISKNTEIEFIETIKSISGDVPHKVLAEFAEKAISKAILGQTLTTDVGDGGAYAAAKVHNDVRLDLAKADTKAIANTIRYQVIRPMVGFNFGWDTAIPMYKPVWEESEDLEKKATWIGELMDRGVKIPISFIRNEFNIPDPEKGEEVLGGSEAGKVYEYHMDYGILTKNEVRQKLGLPPVPGGDKLIEPPQPLQAKLGNLQKLSRIIAKQADNRLSVDDMDNLSDTASIDAQGLMLEFLKPVLTAIENAENLEEIKENIFAAYPDMKSEDMEEMLALAMFASTLIGYGAAQQEAAE